MTHKFRYGRLMAGIALASIIGLTSQAAHAQITIQSNPVFSTPTPGNQPLGPKPKPFEGKVVKFDPSISADETESIDSQDSKEVELGEVTFDGNKYHRDFTINQYLKPITKKEGKTLDLGILEKEVKRINAQNGFKLQGTVTKNEETNAADVHFDVYEQQPWQVSLTTDNQGSPGVGTYRGAVQVVRENLLGIGDKMTMQYLGASRTQRAVATYAFPVNRWGGKVSFKYAFHRLNYDLMLPTPAQPRTIGRDNVWVLSVEQPIGKKREWTPFFSTLWRHVTIDRNGTRVVKADPRPVAFGVKFKKKDKYGSTFVKAASIVGSDWSGGDSRFWRAKVVGKRVFNLPKKNKLVIRGIFQQSPDAMPPVQDITLGGAYSVRGFTERLIVADRGHQLNVEHYWPVPFLGKISPKLKDRVKGVTFFDFGQGWIDNSNGRFAGSNSGRTLLASVGGGLRFNLSRFMQGFVDFGIPLANRNNLEFGGQPNVRVHFGLRSNLLPKPFKKRDK
ncbi:MAG: BamA/TamA family outer membrane protein [Vampirovibrio sp.]|nr:BamA/TamA family outer membrane protein [Vampirovibrio sp.]